MHNAKPQNTRTAGATQRQSASSASAQFTLPLAHFSQLLAHNECLRGGKMEKKGGTGNVHVHKKETMPTTDAATATATAATGTTAAATRRWLCVTHARWTRILRLRGRGVAWSRVIHANTRTQLNEFMLFKLQQSQHSCSSRGAILQVWSVASIVIDSDAINRVIRRRKQRHLASLSCSSIVGKSDQQLSWQFINLQILLPKFLKPNKLAIYCMICKICCQTP